jgi:hypothetical protein
MHTLYAGIIDEMLKNIPEVKYLESPGEFPTNYHWLISEIFAACNRWLELFGKLHVIPSNESQPTEEYIYFNPHSPFVDFIPSCLNFCCKALYKGVEEKRITVDFLAYNMHYKILSEYFSFDLKDEMRGSIEENVIKNIPKEYVGAILSYSLDQEFAGSFDSFKTKIFSGSKGEIHVQLRLWQYLDKMKML